MSSAAASASSSVPGGGDESDRAGMMVNAGFENSYGMRDVEDDLEEDFGEWSDDEHEEDANSPAATQGNDVTTNTITSTAAAAGAAGGENATGVGAEGLGLKPAEPLARRWATTPAPAPLAPPPSFQAPVPAATTPPRLAAPLPASSAVAGEVVLEVGSPEFSHFQEAAPRT